MAWAPDYLTVAELKGWLRKNDSSDDALLAEVITDASRAVDWYCDRQFGSISTAGPRYYVWGGELVEGRQALLIDDLATTTDLVVTVDTDGDGDADQTLVNGTDFDLWPANAPADGLTWTRLVLRGAASAAWPTGYHRAVTITARWGWPAVPAAIKVATRFQAARFFARRNATFGVAGSPEMGSEMRLLERLDPDLVTSLAKFRRPWAAV
jgi:hypothetical protein